jgi:hypothetical protein
LLWLVEGCSGVFPQVVGEVVVGEASEPGRFDAANEAEQSTIHRTQRPARRGSCGAHASRAPSARPVSVRFDDVVQALHSVP